MQAGTDLSAAGPQGDGPVGRGDDPGPFHVDHLAGDREAHVLRDLVHVAAVQFDDPSVTIQFDTESKAATVQRKRAYAEAVKNGQLVAAAHIAFPGIGHVRANGKAYTWVPVNYTVVRP